MLDTNTAHPMDKQLAGVLLDLSADLTPALSRHDGAPRYWIADLVRALAKRSPILAERAGEILARLNAGNLLALTRCDMPVEMGLERASASRTVIGPGGCSVVHFVEFPGVK